MFFMWVQKCRPSDSSYLSCSSYLLRPSEGLRRVEVGFLVSGVADSGRRRRPSSRRQGVLSLGRRDSEVKGDWRPGQGRKIDVGWSPLGDACVIRTLVKEEAGLSFSG